MATFDIDSFDEVEASSGEGDAVSVHTDTEAVALAEAEEAVAKSEVLCARLDPEEEPYRSKYLAREALRIAIKKNEPHAAKGSAAAATAVAQLEWRIGAICMDVQETGGALPHLSRSLRHWRPRLADFIEKLPLDVDGKSTAVSPTEEAQAVAELAAYCRAMDKEQRDADAKRQAASKPAAAAAAAKGGAAGPRVVCGPGVWLEVVECMSHLGIYHHNFEHYQVRQAHKTKQHYST